MTAEISLHSLIASAGKKARRIGRGNAKGGNYSGRGMKGQRARTGGKRGLAKRAIKSFILRVPKSKGFVSLTPGFVVIKVSVLQKHFKDGEVVNLKALKRLGLIKAGVSGVKVLGDVKLTKKLIVKLNAYTKSARSAIVAAGGSVEQASTTKTKKLTS
jgi:large subunit ribosomal protein L15